LKKSGTGRIRHWRSIQQRKERVDDVVGRIQFHLGGFKVIVGMLIGSVSIISEAIHSGMDLLAAVIAMFSVKKSYLPADDIHPFGHGKVESISGLIEAVLIFIAAFWIIFEALRKLMSAGEVESPGWGVAVMFLSAVLNFLCRSGFLRLAKKRTPSPLWPTPGICEPMSIRPWG